MRFFRTYGMRRIRRRLRREIRREAKKMTEQEEYCEACNSVYQPLVELRKLGAGVDISSYTGPHPLRCSKGHKITEHGIMERMIKEK